MRLDKVSIGLLALALFTGCTDATRPEPGPTVQGSWRGVEYGGQTVTLALVQTEISVTGTGTITDVFGGDPIPITVTGTFVPPTLSLTFNSPGYQSVKFTSSSVSPQVINGVLSGSGFMNNGVTLKRQ